MKNHLSYRSASRDFILRDDSEPRIVIGDLCLKFRTVSHRLATGRIMPEAGHSNEAGRERFACRLRGMGSRKTIALGAAPVTVTAQEVGDSLLIGLDNTMGEACFSPDEAVTMTLTELPGVRRSVFFHNRSNEFQNFDCEGLWWSQSVFVKNPCRDLSHEWGLLALWQYEDGRVGGILPVTTGETLGRLRGDERGLSVISSDFRSGTLVEHYSLALLAFGSSLAEVRDRLFVSAAAITPGLSLRESDTLPCAPFNGLGWCSWNAFGKDVCEEDIRSVSTSFLQSKLPVQFMLLDDGWLHHTGNRKGPGLAEGIANHGLVSLDPDPEKFPGGIADLITHAKKCGIQAFGLWHTLNGYWGGIQPDSDLAGEGARDFCHTGDGDCIPRPDGEFFKKWYRRMKSWGVDFVKVDNQGFYRRILPYERSIPAYAQALHGTLQDAAKEAGFAVIHCMATHSELLFQARPGNLLRITNDFVPNDDFSARLHVVNNFYNAFWASRFFCPDFDMFQTADRHAGTFARMLALSHSPIYLTDRPEHIQHELVRKLVGCDGVIPRYERAAVPLDFFSDPYDGEGLFAVAARHGPVVSVGLFNVLRRAEAAAATLCPQELGLCQRCFVWSQSGKTPPQLVDCRQPVRVTLKSMESDILHFSPLQDGLAPVGLTDFIAAPATLKELVCKNGTWLITLTGTGLFTAYAERVPLRILADGIRLEESRQERLQPGTYQWREGILSIQTPNPNLTVSWVE